ncbi:hypothetical protein P3G55_20205 [Leptospira sp. 96542]|nr:hypothetical protein [Leptospira sp. 96542]
MKTGYEANNGILGKVQGQYVAEAIQSLPSPDPGSPQFLTAEVDAGWVGRVRIRFQLLKHRHHKSVHYFWSAEFAEPVSPGPTDHPIATTNQVDPST